MRKIAAECTNKKEKNFWKQNNKKYINIQFAVNLLGIKVL